jgi:hypothetical protein
VNNKENEAVRRAKRSATALNFFHEFEFKIVKRQLVENVALIHKI